MTKPLSSSSDTIVDLFAGPGGWSEGLKVLGYSELGIEWDEAACLTARAAGHERLQADVAALDPCGYPCWGLIASPPCQAWSMAGKGSGRRDVEHVIACAMELGAGSDTRAGHGEKCEDRRSMLVVEPLRWARMLEPEWIALEQVPPVLELWTLFAQILESWGYSTWVGVLEAERYGVPQTRERAVLMASKARTVQPPAPTHQRYIPGEPQRHDVTMLGEVLPWISMAEALGWEEGPSPSPSPSVTGGGGATGGVEVFASKGARDRAARAVKMRANKQENSAVRDQGEPAPTITGGHDTGDRVWVVRTGTNGMKHGRNPEDSIPYERPVSDPSPTIRGGGYYTVAPQGEHPEPPRSWVQDRPSTTVNGDPRISQPGRHDPEESGSQQRNAVRVTVQEAAVLQSFRPDYPWQGSSSKQFQQVGNAVPPLLARAVLAELVDPVEEMRDAA